MGNSTLFWLRAGVLELIFERIHPLPSPQEREHRALSETPTANGTDRFEGPSRGKLLENGPGVAPKSRFHCLSFCAEPGSGCPEILLSALPLFIGSEFLPVPGKSPRSRFKRLGGGGWLVRSSGAKKTRQRASNRRESAFYIPSLSAFLMVHRPSRRISAELG
jgi:hypothetical protein